MQLTMHTHYLLHILSLQQLPHLMVSNSRICSIYTAYTHSTLSCTTPKRTLFDCHSTFVLHPASHLQPADDDHVVSIFFTTLRVLSGARSFGFTQCSLQRWWILGVREE